MEGIPKKPAGYGRRHSVQGCDFNAHPPLLTAKILIDQRLQIFGPKGFFIPSNLRAVRQDLHNGRVEFGEERQKLMSNAISREPKILVARILSPGLPTSPKPIQDLLPARSEQRADQPVLDGRIDRCQTTASRPSQEPVQNGLGLVIHSVSDGDPVGRTGFKEGVEIFIAEPSAGFLKICLGVAGLGADICGGSMNGQPQMCGEVPNEPFILVRLLAAEAVIEVDDGERTAQRGGKLLQNQQQGG